MIAAAALALAAAAAQPDLLAEARTAFEAGAYARAADLALAAAGPEGAAAPDGDALYLAGLARFRDGHPAEALALLDRSGPRADGPAPWHYNRGACLEALGRFPEAERAFLDAARDPALAPVALVNAGYAALSRGAVDEARAHAALARGAAAATLDLVADLEREVAAAAASAREEDARAAALAAASAPRRWTATARVEAGHDSNAIQTGASSLGERAGAAPAAASSPLATTDLAASARFHPGEDLDLETGYGFGQLAYAADGARDHSVQQHDLVIALEGPATARLRLGLAATGQLAFTGLEDFRRLQSAGGARAWATFAWDHAGSTRLEVAWTHQEGSGAEFAYLGGERVEVSLTQVVPLGPASLRLGYRFLADAIGTVEQVVPPGPCGEGCTATASVPYGFDSHTGWLGLRWAPWHRLALDLSAGLEWRRYREDDRLVLTTEPGAPREVWHQRREDLRVLTSALATVALTSRLSLLLRHELVMDRSNLSTAAQGGRGGHDGGMPTSLGDRSYDKRVLSFGLAVGF